MFVYICADPHTCSFYEYLFWCWIVWCLFWKLSHLPSSGMFSSRAAVPRFLIFLGMAMSLHAAMRFERDLDFHQFNKAYHSSFQRRGVQPYAPNGDDATVMQSDPKTTCQVPSIRSTIMVSTPKRVSAGQTFDCGFDKYQQEDTTCNLNSEKGNQYAVFLLEEGATLQNCFLGFSQESKPIISKREILVLFDSWWELDKFSYSCFIIQACIV